MKQPRTPQTHEFPPVWNADSKVLILGSFPSVKSREQKFFYGHPQNRFWKVLATVLDVPVPSDILEKKQMLLSHGIALWDVIASCDIAGSSDSSIKNVVPNDLSEMLSGSGIAHIFVNGKTAGRLYDQYLKQKTGMEAEVLPSTSPANAAYQLECLVEYYKRIKKYL